MDLKCILLGAILSCHSFMVAGQSCKAGTTSGTNTTCEECHIGSFKATEGDTPCTTCPGNRITSSTGSVSINQCLMTADLIQMFPPFGPLAGNTTIAFNLDSQLPWNVSHILVAGRPCGNLTKAGPDTLKCSTSSTRNISSGPVVLTFESMEGPYDVITSNFSYLADPVIDLVHPNETILSGGLTLTVQGSSLNSVLKPQLEVTVISPNHNQKMQWFLKDCKVYNSSLMTCITPNLFGAVPSTNSSRPINGIFGYHVYVGFKLDGVTTYKNISNAVANFRELIVHSNPQCIEKNYVFSEDEYIAIEGVHLNYVVSKDDVTVSIGGSPCEVESIKTNAILCLPPQEPPGGQNTPLINVTFGVGPVVYIIGHLEYKVEPVWKFALAVCFCIAAILAAFGLLLLWMHKQKQKATNNLKRQPSKPNEYIAHRSDSMDEGYLNPTLSESPEVLDNRSSLASRSTASGYSAQSRPSLEELQKRASLASLTLSLVQQRSASISSIISSPSLSPSSPLTSILENGDSLPPTPRAPSVPMSNNMAYFLQPHKLDDPEGELPTLAAQGALLDKSRLKLGDTIGKGFFGKVYKGQLYDENGGNSETVAVKTVQGVQFSEKDVASFLHEAIIMQDFSHQNVLSLLAVVMDEGRPYVVLPFMEYGDLKSYVSDPSRQFTVLKLLGLGVQVASGMAYLASQKFVHRDLACRNCMINKEQCVKIADFGLSRDVYYSQYYRVETKHRPLPVKWMAIESLAEGVFSTKTDVWSFGVLLWELLTRGCPPYADVNSYHIKAYLKSGRRLQKPEHATDEIYEIMLSCWRDTPEGRPTFDALQRRLQDMSENKDVPDYLQIIG